jgi:hypothetical protein
MKRKILVSGIFLTFMLNFINAQTKYSIGGGYGYFADIIQFIDPGYGDMPQWAKINPKVNGKIIGGNNLLFNTSMKLQTGYNINVGLMKATTYSYFNDPLGIYWDVPITDNYFIIDIGFSKNLLNENSRITLEPCLGILYRSYNSPSIDYGVTIYNDGNTDYLEPAFPVFSTLEMQDIGLSFSNDILIKLASNKVQFGFKVYTYILFGIGIEAISISPILKFNI